MGRTSGDMQKKGGWKEDQLQAQPACMGERGASGAIMLSHPDIPPFQMVRSH